MQRIRKSALSYSAVFLVLCAIGALAAPAHAYDDPSARVARLNFIQGEVTFQPGGEDDWVWARLNRPLTDGDSLWTQPGARAELHVGSTAIRLDEQSALTISNIDDNTIQLQLSSGTMNLRVRSLYDNDVIEVDTPNIAFTVTALGNYRITVDPDGYTTIVTVWDGEGQVTGGDQAFLVDGGSQAQVSGTDSLSYDIYDLPYRDEFDQWSAMRDEREDRARSLRYVSPEMTGYEDLDNDGTWITDSNYGPVWVPTNVSSDWAPYRNGHWVWVSPWGWTWVDNEQFGFVTSHYGRWAHLNNIREGGGWAWIPPRRERDNRNRYITPVYSPALVTFADDSNSSNGFGFGGGVAWFPLAPGEVYVPAYKTSTTYITQVNITNTVVQQTVITNVVNNPTRPENYANERVAGAVTAVPKTVFVNAQPVAQAAVRVSPRAIAAASIVRAAPVAPVKASVTGGTGPRGNPAVANARVTTPARPPTPPPAVFTRPVVAKVAPPPPPVPFAQKQRALAQNAGKPLDPRVEQSLRAAAPPPARVVKEAPPVTVVKAAVAKPKPQSMAPVANGKPGSPQNTRPPVNTKSVQTPAPAVTPAIPALNQQQLAQQQAEKARQQQLAQQQADKARLQQQQSVQQTADRARQQQLAQQQADKARLQQPQLAQQEAEKAHQQQLAQQQADKARLQQQQLAQQEAEKARQQQLAQQEADKARQQQLAQQQADAARLQQQKLAQQEADKARQQQLAQQQAEKARQEQAQQQQARRGNPPPNNARNNGGGATDNQPVRVPEGVQAGKLVSQPRVAPPVDANGARIRGVVRLQALIGTDGRVRNVSVLSGPQALQAAALENARQRQYQPTVMNGKPVEVETQISINFQ
ncbi:MAG TPA: TonB family protein [Candidatus Acidoferrales bacterium]|nr:TonB family protein [Candidatus Acidoferrales bacterium]